MLEVKENVVSLKGISLRGSFEIFNPNQNLAVIFQVSTPRQINLQIQPKRGIAMQREVKKIRVWVQDQDREKVMYGGWQGYSIRIDMTMRTEYNRKIFEKLQMRGWDQISNKLESMTLPIVISPQSRNLRFQLQQQAKQSSSNFYENIHKNINTAQQFEEGKVYQSRFSSSIGSQKRKSHKFDKDLNFIFQKKQKRSKPYQYNNQNFHKTHQPTYKNYHTPSNSVSISKILEPYENRRVGSSSDEINDKDNNNQRFMQLILLAALSGFFLALGSNLRQLFS